jgi:cobaltochelatase CobS
MSMSDREMAVKALDWMSGESQEWRWLKTTSIRVGINITIEEQAQLRRVLERLLMKQVVYKDVTGSHKWKIRNKNFDRNNPFATKAGGGEEDASDKPAKPAGGLYTDPAQTIYWKNIAARRQEEIDKLEKELEAAKEAHKAFQEGSKDYTQRIATLEARIKELEESGGSSVKTLVIKHYEGKTYKLKDVTLPKVFDRVRQLAECRRNILLVGPAGCGKTFLGKLIADTLALDFASLSCTAGMSESHLLGRAVPDLTHGKNRFQGTDFLKVFEEGGVGLLDEFDAADPNLLLSINTGLANGYMNVPNRAEKPRAVRHKDFVCIATANTFGRGATRQYAGRNQLDEATLDRFRIGIVECGYDENVERVLCPDNGSGKPFIHYGGKKESLSEKEGDVVDKIIDLGYNLRGTCQYIRHKIEEAGLRRIMSSRFMEDAQVMKANANWTIKQIVETFTEGWTTEEKAKLVV